MFLRLLSRSYTAGKVKQNRTGRSRRRLGPQFLGPRGGPSFIIFFSFTPFLSAECPEEMVAEWSSKPKRERAAVLRSSYEPVVVGLILHRFSTPPPWASGVFSQSTGNETCAPFFSSLFLMLLCTNPTHLGTLCRTMVLYCAICVLRPARPYIRSGDFFWCVSLCRWGLYRCIVHFSVLVPAFGPPPRPRPRRPRT